MTGRRNGNRIRGPQSALTDFLAANNISAAQIRDDYERRRREAIENGEGPSEAAATAAGAVVEDATAQLVADDDSEAEREKEKSKKRKRSSEKDAIEKIKKAKVSKKGKGKDKEKDKKGKKKGKKDDYDDDDDDSDDEFNPDLGRDMYKKARPAPGQFENCDTCGKRFTVTAYNIDSPDGGLLCMPCGKEVKKDIKAEKKAVAKPAGRQRRKQESDKMDGMANRGAKTLQQLCIETVAKHHDDVEELGDMPGPVVARLSEIFSKRRVLKPKTLPLFLRPDLDSVILHDAAYLEANDYNQIFAVVPDLQRLVLGNTCQMKDPAMDYMLERCHKLKHVQLYASNLVSNDMWHKFFQVMGQRLETLKLKWLDAAFEDDAVEKMAARCKNLSRLKLELCRRIGEPALNAIATMPNLEHLSLHIGREVSSDILVNLIQQRGPKLRTLSLKKFLDADDAVIQAIHDSCANLQKLRVSENDTISDAAFTALFTNWSNPPLHFVDVNATRDIDNNNPDGPDEATGLASNAFRALMSHSGSALKHLDISSCRHIDVAAFEEVFKGATVYPCLEEINVSFCNRVDTIIVGAIFKSCPALKRLVAFGCFSVDDVVVPRNVALVGVPRAQDAIEQFGVDIGVEEALGRMIEVDA
jgi:DNA repair protein RAD7